MPNVQLLATDPADGRYLKLICDAYATARPTTLNVAVAYATHSGVADLIARLETLDGWIRVRKKWLVGIDFCRSDPIALQYLHDLPHSETRINDGAFVVARNGCVPRASYHPKLFAFSRGPRTAVVAGSGNLSHTGLCIGTEAGMAHAHLPAAEVRNLRNWFNRRWRSATQLAAIANEYAVQYRRPENRSHPAPTEDDAAPESAGTRGQLTAAQLRKLGVCEHLWIQAGNLHENRGAGRPGNQLMLKRNSRVYFGFPARDLPTDTTIGSVAIEYAGLQRADCSLRFSNNSMDVLTLPIPGSQGPAAYDKMTICFERVGLRQFRLVLGKPRDLARWKRQSKVIDGYFQMSSGREWGVF